MKNYKKSFELFIKKLSFLVNLKLLWNQQFLILFRTYCLGHFSHKHTVYPALRSRESLACKIPFNSSSHGSVRAPGDFRFEEMKSYLANTTHIRCQLLPGILSLVSHRRVSVSYLLPGTSVTSGAIVEWRRSGSLVGRVIATSSPSLAEDLVVKLSQQKTTHLTVCAKRVPSTRRLSLSSLCHVFLQRNSFRSLLFADRGRCHCRMSSFSQPGAACLGRRGRKRLSARFYFLISDSSRELPFNFRIKLCTQCARQNGGGGGRK